MLLTGGGLDDLAPRQGRSIRGVDFAVRKSPPLSSVRFGHPRLDLRKKGRQRISGFNLRRPPILFVTDSLFHDRG